MHKTNGQIKFLILVNVFLMGTLASPIYAQKLEKLSTELKKAGEFATVANRVALNNPAFAAALQHAQALQTLRETSLPASQQAASRGSLSTSIVPSNVTLQNTKRSKSSPLTPQQWLDELEIFVQLNNRYPFSYNEEERMLYVGARNIIQRLGPNNPISQRIRQLREQYPVSYKTKPPKQWLEELETFVQQNKRFPSQTSKDLLERKLYTNISEMIRRLGPDNPIAQRASLLRKQYPIPIRNTPQQWLEKLEAFVEENGRFPSQMGKDETERALYINTLVTVWRLGSQDPIAQRILEIRKQYPGIQRGKSAQQWLDELEIFVQKEGCLPSQGISAQETSLYNGIWRLRTILDKKDPILQRIEQLYIQFIPRSGPLAKTPEQWLEELETFVEQNGRFPTTKNGVDEKKLYAGVMNLRYRFGSQDPIVQRIIQLRTEYNNQPSAF